MQFCIFYLLEHLLLKLVNIFNQLIRFKKAIWRAGDSGTEGCFTCHCDSRLLGTNIGPIAIVDCWTGIESKIDDIFVYIPYSIFNLRLTNINNEKIQV